MSWRTLAIASTIGAAVSLLISIICFVVATYLVLIKP